SVLICAVRDSCVSLIERENDKFSSVIDVLRESKWKTFQRLELYLSRMFPILGLSTAEAFFGNLEKFDDTGFQKEAVLLLKDIFPQLSEPSRQKILQWIEKGPSDELKEWLRKQEGVTEADVDSYVQRWRRDHFGILDSSLPEEYAKNLSDLVAQS